MSSICVNLWFSLSGFIAGTIELTFHAAPILLYNKKMKQLTLAIIFAFFAAFGELGTQEIFAADGSPEGESFLTPKAVEDALAGGIDYLVRMQQPNGSWAEYPGYPPGATALCTLALLSAGLDAEHPTIVKALEYLRTFTPEMQNQTYPISLQTMVLCQASPKKDLPLIQRNVDWLADRQFNTQNVYRGGWSYTGIAQANSRTDNSNSQFAMLALYEAEKAGAAIPDRVWREAEGYWTRMQNADGSWGYTVPKPDGTPINGNVSHPVRGSMTCAGIAALAMIGDLTAGGASRVEGGRVECCRPVQGDNAERIERGIEWLAEHFSVRNNPGTAENSDTYVFYYLYGLERTGRLTSLRHIGQADWYREGADYLLRRKGLLSQFWRAPGDLRGMDTLSTSFALLFLSKGRWPVLISKLRYRGEEAENNGSDGAPEWNLHPNDLAHLTQFAEKEWDRPMIWQVIDAEKATADDYLQTPVLSISGRHSPLPSDAGKRRALVEALRGYLEQGGFLLAEALDGDESFETGFAELIQAIFPEEENGGLHLLPEEHPIWNFEKNVPPEELRPIYGVDFGCRTSVIFVPPVHPQGKLGERPSVDDDRPSLSCLWELAGNLHRKSPYPEPVQKQVDAGLGLGLNILAYATGRDLKFKEEIPESAAADSTEKNFAGLFVAILDHGGGSACAPRAIPNLLRKLTDDLGIPVETTVERIRASSPDLFRCPVLFQHGRSAYTLSDAEIAQMREFFNRGGFLFANAICASAPFKASFIENMKKIFPGEELQPVPLDDPLWSNALGGYAIDQLEIRRPKRAAGRKIRVETESAPPELLGIQKEGRWVVLFSPYDVSCALEKSGSVECTGYTTESALKLSINILLYAAEQL